MKKICIIVPYFGKLPSYFKLWAKSAACNYTIDFLIFTDNKLTLPHKNIQIINIDFKEMQEFIQSKFTFKISLEEPYELTKFKPAYGFIFESYINGYDFWGYCDLDLIFGDIRRFITDDILDNYDKVLSHGHLTLYRNSEKMRNLFMTKRDDCLYYKNVFKSHRIWNNFDEYPYGIARIANKEGIAIYEKMIFADIDMFTFSFRKIASYLEDCKDDAYDILQYFKWDNGKLYDVIVDKEELKSDIINEIAYVHFQKRDMNGSYINSIEDSFIMIPNMFCPPDIFNKSNFISVRTDEANNKYLKLINIQVKERRTKNTWAKYFSVQRWLRKIFLIKMKYFYHVEPYKFERGGFDK